jgi:Tfp pilus assembly PilM family ATPase
MHSLTGFFGRHRRLLIGVDISDTQVRVVSLSKQAGRYIARGYPSNYSGRAY